MSVHLRIFLSSPGDVVEERQLARDAIAELQHEPQFEAVRLEAVSWDDPHGRTPLVAQLDPQTAVERGLPKPSECDVVVGIFWTRMGSPLPTEWRKVDGSAYLSGTEYELEDAFGANPGPDVLLYRRSEEPKWGARDPDRKEKEEQFELIEKYVASLKATKRFVDEYPGQAEFKDRLKNDLRKVLARGLETTPIADTFQQVTPAEVGDERLERAEQRLAAMPLDVVPAPAALPKGSHMPLARNALFVGREEDLKALARALKAAERRRSGRWRRSPGSAASARRSLRASSFIATDSISRAARSG